MTKHREGDNPNFFLYKTLPLLDLCLQWRSKVAGTLVKTVQKITKESFGTTIVIFKGTI